MAGESKNSKRPGKGTLLALAILPALLYANTLGNSFHYDDSYLIADNRYVHSLSGIGHFFVSPRLISNVPLSGYRPLTMATFVLNYAIGGDSAMGYHAVNVLIHVLSTLLVYALCLALMRTFQIRHHAYAALAVAVLFAAHPINTQPVNYIAGRSTLLVGCFSLACFLLYTRAREAPATLRGKLMLVGSLIAYLCALLSKEEAVALPGLLVVYEFFSSRGQFDRKGIQPAFLRLLPFVVLTLCFLVFVILILGVVGSTEQPRGVWENLLTQAKVFFLYVKLILLPTNLSIDHVVPVSTSLFAPAAMLAVVGVVIVLLGSAFLIRVAPVVPFGIWWMAIVLVPTSTLVALRLVLNEQRLYFAAIGILFIAGAAFARTLERAESTGRNTLRRALICGFAAVLIILAALTIRRNAQWRTPTTLWSSALELYPDSPRANTQMANIYLEAGRTQDALERARKAVEIAPDVVESRVALATAYSRLGRHQEALAEARAAVDLNPGWPGAQATLGTVYARLERYREAEAAWKRALELDPQSDEARDNLERLRRILENGATGPE